jgi:Uma2 family endonuclease
MVATPVVLETPSLETPILNPSIRSLEDWMDNPPDGTEWVDGKLIAKHPEWVDGEFIEPNGMTLKHSQVQSRLVRQWGSFKDDHDLGGEVYTEAPCQTAKRGRVPDVAYLTPSLFAQHQNAKMLPQSFPLSAEIISPTDFAEDVVAKAEEYLQSGGEEVWLVFPESRWVIVVTSDTKLIFASGEVAKTQKVLLGFEVAVDGLVG